MSGASAAQSVRNLSNAIDANAFNLRCADDEALSQGSQRRLTHINFDHWLLEIDGPTISNSCRLYRVPKDELSMVDDHQEILPHRYFVGAIKFDRI
jgi:hypothetical protein